MEGWIKLHRNVQNNWIFKEHRKFSKFEAWVDILLTVNHKDAKVIIGSKLIECLRGQCILSLDSWAVRWRWDKWSVRRFLMLLQEDNMLLVENVQKTTRITVCKYDDYQTTRNSDATILQQSCNDDATSLQPPCNAPATDLQPNNNDNNKKNDKNKKNEEINKEDIIPENEFSGSDDSSFMDSDLFSSAEVDPSESAPGAENFAKAPPKPPPKKSKPKKPAHPAFQPMVDYWVKVHFPDYQFGAIDGQKINGLISKLEKSIQANGGVPSAEEVLRAFQLVCQNMPTWYKTQSLAVVDSKYNELIAEIKKSRDGTKTDAQQIYERVSRYARAKSHFD